jgi:O-antigen/teichoic acid export membrane protein
VLRVTFQPWKFIALNVLNTVAVGGLSILFVVVMKRHVSGVLYGRLCGDALTALVGFVLIRHSLRRRFDRPLLSRLLAFAVPLIPAAIAFWAISYADRWVLVHYTNLTLVGVYAVAVKISTLMLLGISAFQLAWGPFAYAHAREAGAGRTFSRVLTLYAAGAAFLALALGLFAPEALRILVPEAYRGAAVPGAILAFGVVAFGGYSIVGMGANLAYRTDLQAWCSASAAFTPRS